MPTRLTVYRDHPADGSLSMDRYATSLVAALRQMAPPGWVVSSPIPPRPLPGVYGRLCSRVAHYPVWARAQAGCVNHVTDHSYGQLLFALNAKTTVVTVHDVAPLRYPGRRLGASGLAWRLAWKGVERARTIITDSEFVRSELQTLLSVDQTVIHSVPIGVSGVFQPQPREQSERLRRRYLPHGGRLILHVGHAQPRKNLPTLLRAMRILRQRDPGIHLVQIGGQADAVLGGLVSQLSVESVVHFAGRLSEADLIAHYPAADLFVFPSLYEGFGLPVLEAMACGTPVVAANAASLPEVVGDAGMLVDPLSAEGLADAISALLASPARRAEMTRRGIERARQYSWNRTARETLAVYQQVLEGTRLD